MEGYYYEKKAEKEAGFFGINPLTREQAEGMIIENFGEKNLPQFKKYLDSMYSRAKRSSKKPPQDVTKR